MFAVFALLSYCGVVVVLLTNAAAAAIVGSGCDPLFSPIRCGVPKLQPGALPSRPSEAIRGEFPWHAALYQNVDGNFSYSCGGSLVNERFVITAAHCVINPNNGYRITSKRLKVLLGGHELGAEDECVQEMTVQNIYVHDEYRLGDYRHDIAAVELTERVSFTQRILPVCVDLSEREDSSFFKLHGKVAGWGYTEYDSVSNWLRMTELPFVNYTTCLASNPPVFSQTIYEGMFCAGYANGTSVCNGDSGGGLVSFSRDHWVLRGIVSFTALRDGEKTICDSEEFAGFTKVRFYRDWLGGILNATDSTDRSVLPIAKKTPEAVPEEDDDETWRIPCGERKINKLPLIVNGVRSYSGEWPWHVAIFEVNGRQKRYICGGTLISDQFVMTAAHCTLDDALKPRPGTMVVQLGQNDLFESSVNMREVRVDKITTHPLFDPVSKTNDIALLELSSNVQFNDYIQPACLPKKQDSERLNLFGMLGSIIGWGYQQPWSFMVSNTLQSTKLPVVDQSLCVVGGNFGREMEGVFCVGSGNGSNACTGDSGGGMFFEEGGLWTARGVISALDTVNGFCNPDGYLKVASTGHFLKWIKRQIKAALELIKGGGERKMTFLQTATDYTTPQSSEMATSNHSHIHHHYHHHHYHGSDGQGRPPRKRCQDSSSEESGESGLKRLIKKKKCFIKDITSGLLSKLF
ncbi:transmembrane protease serine 9-like isoform X2 [Malaya genurostris]|uniref:transmembrane protease serine 9-like isoform X2 n=1 Tax=Malaya genurostris TaxID=325434 RepID=UPI0026F3E9C8|nr:transmembrane protease serine 9-like isoform X2 [Malaya genurostris]